MAKWIVGYRDNVSVEQFTSNPSSLYLYKIAGHFTKWADVVDYLNKNGTKHDNWKISAEEK